MVTVQRLSPQSFLIKNEKMWSSIVINPTTIIEDVDVVILTHRSSLNVTLEMLLQKSRKNLKIVTFGKLHDDITKLGVNQFKLVRLDCMFRQYFKYIEILRVETD